MDFLKPRELPNHEYEDYEGLGLLQFTPVGDWERVIKEIQRLGPTIKAAGIKAQIRLCNLIMHRVKEHLHNQDLPWAPLSASHIKAKKIKGFSTDILSMSHAYYNAIGVFQKGHQHMVFVGVPRGIYGVDIQGNKNPKEIALIAAIHEFSYKDVYKRPLWNPTIEELGGPRGIRDIFLGYFYAELRIRKVPVELLKNPLKIKGQMFKF